MGQGSPLPAFLKCDGEWIVENHVYLYYSDNDPAHIAPAPTFGASRHDGAPCVGFDVAQLAAILHVNKTTVLNANHDLALIFLGTADVPPKYGGASATAYGFRIGDVEGYITIEINDHKGIA